MTRAVRSVVPAPLVVLSAVSALFALSALPVPSPLGILSTTGSTATAGATWGSVSTTTLSAQQSASPGTPVRAPLRIDGVALEAPRRPTPPERMAEVAALGAEWVAVIPYAFIRRETGEVVFDRDGQYWGERREGVEIQIEQARAHGMRVMLKPHVWLRGGSGWAGDYLPGSEEEWGRWEEGYRAYVLGAARVAAELDMGMLCVGTELKRLVEARPDFFRELIADVRELYHGPLTYAANWDAYRTTPFWDQLDFIGIDAYFPLSGNPDASVTELVEAWEPVVEEVRAYAQSRGRPVLFAEYGYRSVEGAAGEQWLLPPERRTHPSRIDPVIQARAYEALYRAWWAEEWFAGGFFWEWHLAEAGRGGAWERGSGSAASGGSPDRAGPRAAGFTPEGKPAEAVVRRWYRASGARAVD